MTLVAIVRAILIIMLFPISHAGLAADRDCPTFATRVQIAGDGSARADALNALNAGGAGQTGSELMLDGSAATGVGVWFRADGGNRPRRPDLVLQHGTDFTCDTGWLVFARTVDAYRRIDEQWYEGRSTVRLRPAVNGGVDIAVAFTGSQRTTLYSYDSARISIPKPGTRRMIAETWHWPIHTAPIPGQRTAAPAKESPVIALVRRTLSGEILGAVQLATLQDRGDAVLATLKAPQSADALAFEDRLRAAAIPYKTRVSPIWSERGYHMEMLVWPKGSAAAKASRPSEFRVEQEMRRMRQPNFDVVKVKDTGEEYVASVNLLGPANIASYVEFVQSHSTMFGEISVIDERVHPQYPKLRVAKLRLRLR